MKKLFVSILLCWVSWSVFAQTNIPGFVRLYGSKSEGIPYAKIVRDNGDAAESDNNGSFSISISEDYDRKQVRLKVIPPTADYVVMEVDGLYHYIADIDATAGRVDPLIITLCSKKVYEDMVLKLAKPYIDKLLEEQEIELTALYDKKAQLTETDFKKQLEFVKEKYELFQKEHMELTAKMARIDPEHADEYLRKARECFEEGNIEGAKKYLPSYERAKGDVVRGKMVMSLWLSFAKIERNFYDVRQKYDDILVHTGVPESYNLLFECSEYLFQNRIFDASLVNESLKYAVTADSLYKLPLHSKIYFNNLVGKITKEQGKKDYYENYKESVIAYIGNKKDTLNHYESKKNVAISYTLLADYYKEKRNTQKAEDNYKEALRLYIILFKKNKSDNLNYLQCLIKIADFYSMTGKRTLLAQCNERIDTLIKFANLNKENLADINMLMGNLNLNSSPFEAYIKYDFALRYYLTKDRIIYKDKAVKAALGAALACNNDGFYTKVFEYCDTISNRVNIDSTARGAAVHALLGNAYKRGKILKNKEKTKYYFSKAEEISKKIKDKRLDDFIYSIKHERWIVWRDGFVYPVIGWGTAYFSYLILI